jgi:SAM-dependent methyltransferase
LNPYTKSFFREQAERSEASAARVIPELLTLLSPKSVIDVGCGVGTWVKTLKSHGVEDSLGIDGSYVDQASLLIKADSFFACDIQKPFALGRTFDVAMSLEVAEHLSFERAESFISDLCKLAPVVLFSAAIPGQAGTNHVNEQWPTYWAALFQQNGFVIVERFGERFWSDPSVGPEYAQNMFIYASEHALAASPKLLSLHATAGRLIDVVHPYYWEHVGLRRVVEILPTALSMAARRRIGWYGKGSGRKSGASKQELKECKPSGTS